MKIFSTNGDMSGKAHQQQQKIFFKESFFRFFMLALLKSLHRHKNGKMAKALTPYVCMMIFLSTPVKRNVCKSHFYATQTSLSLSLTYTQFIHSIHDGGRKSLFLVKFLLHRETVLLTKAFSHNRGTTLSLNKEVKGGH